MTCHGIDPKPYAPWVAHLHEPGEYCFPPLASLITGAARLMLALLEHEVVLKLGGTYAMEDTDSMAIVAPQNGKMTPCPGVRNVCLMAAKRSRRCHGPRLMKFPSDRCAESL